MAYYSGPVQSPRMISFIAADEVGATSMQAFAIINFESIDNPPMIDLNGNMIAGMNFSAVFTEGSSAIPVRYLFNCVYDNKYFIITICFRLLILKLPSLILIQKIST